MAFRLGCNALKEIVGLLDNGLKVLRYCVGMWIDSGVVRGMIICARQTDSLNIPCLRPSPCTRYDTV